MYELTYILIAAAVLVVLLFLYLLIGRKQRVQFGATTIAPPKAAASLAKEGHGVGSEVTAAIEDVIDQFVGIDAHPSGQPTSEGPGDTLTLIKGLGPKAASRLAEIGVSRFAQIASWDDGDVAAIDGQMGAFKGRIARDRWVDQARLLAKGDNAAFEAEFGKLGSDPA